MTEKDLSPNYVLAIDDDYETTVLLERLLTRMNYRCQSTQTGAEGLALLRSDPAKVGLLLLDLAMPDLSGYDVCRIIRADPLLKAIPVVALTAAVDKKSLDHAFEVGVNEVITKPFKSGELERILTTHFRS